MDTLADVITVCSVSMLLFFSKSRQSVRHGGQSVTFSLTVYHKVCVKDVVMFGSTSELKELLFMELISGCSNLNVPN